MTVCDFCDQEMSETDHCQHGIDKSVIPDIPNLKLRNCGDCGVAPGALHHPGCDMEQCPRCSGQSISCNCVYEINGIDVDTMMEELHPDIYTQGATDEMYEKWDAEWGDKRVRWTGVSAGHVECLKLGLFCRDLYADGTPHKNEDGLPWPIPPGFRWHIPCDAMDEGAHPDLNRWVLAGYPTGD